MKINEYFYHLKGKDDFVTKNHSHNEIELIQVIEGQGTVLKSDKTFGLKSGYLYIIDARKPHIVYPADTDAYVRNKIVIDADSFTEFCNETGLLTEAERLFIQPAVFTGNDAAFDTLFKKVYELCSTKRSENIGFAHGYILEILHKASVLSASNEKNENNGIIQDILDIISEKDGVTGLSEISSALHMNKYYVCHLFKEKTGITLSDYISEKVYEKCISLIIGSTEPFDSVAIKCGFGASSSLTRFVKNRCGKCPKDIRRDGYV